MRRRRHPRSRPPRCIHLPVRAHRVWERAFHPPAVARHPVVVRGELAWVGGQVGEGLCEWASGCVWERRGFGAQRFPAHPSHLAPPPCVRPHRLRCLALGRWRLPPGPAIAHAADPPCRPGAASSCVSAGGRKGMLLPLHWEGGAPLPTPPRDSAVALRRTVHAAGPTHAPWAASAGGWPPAHVRWKTICRPGLRSTLHTPVSAPAWGVDASRQTPPLPRPGFASTCVQGRATYS